jgi:membrane-associated HD superfamily phosphohydrolase
MLSQNNQKEIVVEKVKFLYGMKQKLSIICASIFTFIGSYSYVFAQPRTLKDLIENTIIGNILAPLIPIIIGFAVVFFIWGVFKFVIAQGADDKSAGKQFMFWGIVGLFVIISLWGLVRILERTFNLNTSDIQVRQVNIPR